MRTATAVWTIRPELLIALDERLGSPIDSYVNGSQTWITADGPGEIGLEWRLHPVAGFRRPVGLPHEEIWEAALAAIAAGADAAALTVGSEVRPLASLWDGLECFAAYGDEVEPAPLAAATTQRLGVAPDHLGLVDHEVIGDAWERAKGDVSIVALLVDQLGSTPSP